jgi:flagellar basal body-associated protein FliL
MADEDKKKDEAEETQETAPKAPAKKSPLMMIIGALVVVLLLGGGGFYFFTQMKPAEAAEGEEVDTGDITETNIYFDGFATNIANLEVSEDYDYLYLKYGFDVEVSDNAVIAEIVSKLPRLTSVAASVMSNQNYTEICESNGRERLARELMRAMNDQLTTGEIIGVYFHTFVAQ